VVLRLGGGFQVGGWFLSCGVVRLWVVLRGWLAGLKFWGSGRGRVDDFGRLAAGEAKCVPPPPLQNKMRACPPSWAHQNTHTHTHTHTGTFAICCTSSLVGAMISPMGPSPVASGGWSFTCRSRGRTKAIVLPEPVLAMPMQSRPDMMMGSAWGWGVEVHVACGKCVQSKRGGEGCKYKRKARPASAVQVHDSAQAQRSEGKAASSKRRQAQAARRGTDLGLDRQRALEAPLEHHVQHARVEAGLVPRADGARGGAAADLWGGALMGRR